MKLGFYAKVAASLDQKLASGNARYESDLNAAELEIYYHLKMVNQMTEEEYQWYSDTKGMLTFIEEFNARWERWDI